MSTTARICVVCFLCIHISAFSSPWRHVNTAKATTACSRSVTLKSAPSPENTPIPASSLPIPPIASESSDFDGLARSAPTNGAVTNTVSQRLRAELKTSLERLDEPDRFETRMKTLSGMLKSEKTMEEREASWAEVRNLNGVNPVVSFVAGMVGLGFGSVLFATTKSFTRSIVENPISEDDLYFVQRTTQVGRNLLMGIMTMGTGFTVFASVGVLCLSIRVAYGVMTGELDPTPIKKKPKPKKEDEFELPSAWDLMTGKKPPGVKNKTGMFGL